jgi:outer membrane protein TolC
LAFPPVVDTVLLQATLGIPLSDYFLRINKQYSAASHSVEAARHDVEAARARAGADAQVAYYTWLKARATLDASESALATARVHLQDAESLFASGNAPKADVLHARSAVAAAESTVVAAQSFVDVTLVQLEVAMAAPEGELFAPTESLDTQLPPVREDLGALVREGQSNRAEVKSLDTNAAVLRDRAKATSAERWPSLAAFGDVTVGHPNTRRFPLEPEWFPTWSAGVRLSWTPTDLPAVAGRSDELLATLATLEAQRNALRKGIRVEVTTQWHAVQVADQTITSARLELESARETYAGVLDRYRAGSATSTMLSDAEAELTRVRLSIAEAQTSARIARVRLAQAVGRSYSEVP